MLSDKTLSLPKQSNALTKQSPAREARLVHCMLGVAPASGSLTVPGSPEDLIVRWGCGSLYWWTRDGAIEAGAFPRASKADARARATTVLDSHVELWAFAENPLHAVDGRHL